MKAIVYHGRKDVRYEDWPEPGRLGPSEVRVQVKYAGICHTDFNEYAHGPIFTAATPHFRTGRSVPLVVGHEFSGEVVEVGSKVQQLKPGDRVAVNAVDACRHCEYCRREKYALCPAVAYLGFSRDGGLAEYTVAPEACCYRLPPAVSYRAGVVVEPLSAAMHAVGQARLALGDRVVVVGGGAVGLCVLQVLRAAGASQVFVVEKSETKRRFAMELGATAAIDPVQNLRLQIEAYTDDWGVNTTFECVGSELALRSALAMTKPGGLVCIVGIFPSAFKFNFNHLLAQEKTIVTSLAYGPEFGPVIDMLADSRLRAEPLITRTLPLAQAVEQGLRQYEEFAPTNIRTLIEIDSN
jgi:(R,R)-butanediol dehydrogenase/meso-butanediol dehydrogenase/diacetyl reductase